MGGSPFNWDKKEQDLTKPHIEVQDAPKDKPSWINYTDIKYMGGHKAFPKSVDTRVYFYSDRMEIVRPELIIPYSAIYNIENADRDRITLFRVVMFGVIGALWKKNHVYTVIQYRDEWDNQTIILDFGRFIEKLQPFIYRKMLEFRKR